MNYLYGRLLEPKNILTNKAKCKYFFVVLEFEKIIYSLATNKHLIIHFQTLDECFRNNGKITILTI